MSSGLPETNARRYHRVGKYQVLAHLATGGMGVVYKALDTETGREVALKVLSPALASKPIALERFRREARQGTKLRHENVATIYECGEASGTFFLALEFVDGIDLHEYVDQRGPLPAGEAVALLTQMARALDCLHQNQIIHRDLKPSNFLLTQPDGRPVVKLIDLGVARESDAEESRVTQAGHTVGTVDYMAPEQARDSGQADIRSDLYSLGCTFYHLLTGRPPFPEGSIPEKLLKHLEKEPADVREVNPGVPLPVLYVLRRMTAKKPANRYQATAELLRDLEAIGRGELPVGTPSAEETATNSSPTPPDVTTVTRAPRRPDGQPRSRERQTSLLPSLTPEQRQAAFGQFERASQAITEGQREYALHLLRSCCKLDPGNLVFRQGLRRLQRAGQPKAKRARPLDWLAALVLKLRLKAAKQTGRHFKVLEYGESLLARRPDDLPTQLDMARSAEALGIIPLGVWLLEQVWSEEEHTPVLTRALARLYEKQGSFGHAGRLWKHILRSEPGDIEAHHKVQHLAAKETIVRGQYEAAVRETG
jgi:serine/threonine protein kinase